MKGIIFTEFLELVENAFGLDMADDIIEACDLPSGGRYTAVGSYDHSEIVALVRALSEATHTPVPELLRTYGEHLFGRFTTLYPQFFADADDGFEFLENVEGYIHVEVRKLYPNADLPTFEHRRLSEDELELTYYSSRHLEDVAEGLIIGCMKHFETPAQVDRAGGDSERGIRFTIRKSLSA